MIDVRTAPADPDARAPQLGATPDETRRAAGRLGRGLTGPEDASFGLSGVDGDRLTAFVEGLLLGTYRARSSDGPSTTVRLCGATDREAVERGRLLAQATAWARDLANTPAGTKTPAWLGVQAETVLNPLGVTVTVRDEAWLAEHHFGGVLAVGGGSASPPRLIEAQWRPRKTKPGVHLVLVGKGITFDTGGVNRKPGDSMRTMHTDMSGGAAVLAAMRLIAAEKLPVRVTALVPAAENALSGSSYRPGDVIRHVGGRTSEITNTDAEGRIVLADALAYAAATLRPSAMVDIATLTGAMKVALGTGIGGVLGTSDPVVDGLIAAGAATGEPLWRLPLPVEYEGTLRSDIADANNAPGNPGGITAALFLRPFAGGIPWAHLDVAGPARAAKDDGLIAAGATGFGARLLHRWVRDQS